MEKRILGIEFGSTRIKSVLIDETGAVLATGGYDWQNILVDGLWSYDMNEVFRGLRACYSDLLRQYGQPIVTLDAIGISGMMHGYLAFDENDTLLAPFRTWRNTNTAEAAAELSELFRFNVPMRWSVAQYYQSVLDGLDHVKKVRFLTTLAGYVHYKLTGRKVLGIGDVSGMFPVDDRKQYDPEMLRKFDEKLREHGLNVTFSDLLPDILLAGEEAGTLTEAGAALLDESGTLRPGCPLCPPEGDMGTGMVCTDCITPRTASFSLGTSANMTVVLERNLKHYYPEIDVIATPDGSPAALIHTNTCTSVLDSWVGLFGEAIELAGGKIGRGELFTKLFRKSLESDPDTGKIVAYNYLAGEPIAHTIHGAPMTFTAPDGTMSLANFMQAQINAAIATLALGLDILNGESVAVDTVLGHGGYFKTPFVGQNTVSAMMKAPVTVMATAGEGGAWGIALLALYLFRRDRSLGDFLSDIFAGAEKTTVLAEKPEQEKFAAFLARYRAGLDAERLLTESIGKEN